MFNFINKLQWLTVLLTISILLISGCGTDEDDDPNLQTGEGKIPSSSSLCI